MFKKFLAFHRHPGISGILTGAIMGLAAALIMGCRLKVPVAVIPPPSSGCIYPAAEAQLVAFGYLYNRLPDVLRGERALGDLRDPARNGAALARENNRKLASWLRDAGFCAFAGNEAIFIKGLYSFWEEYAAAETDGGWTQTPVRGSHVLKGPTTPVPPDSPLVLEAQAERK
jgi:hypothetical protein